MFPLTQEPAPQPECAGSSNDGVARAVPAPAAGQHQDAPTASDDSGSNNAQESFLELCPAADFSETPERPEEPKDGIPSVTEKMGRAYRFLGTAPTWKTDREIMQRTLLLGARGDRHCFPRLGAAFSLERRWEEEDAGWLSREGLERNHVSSSCAISNCPTAGPWNPSDAHRVRGTWPVEPCCKNSIPQLVGRSLPSGTEEVPNPPWRLAEEAHRQGAA